MPMRRIVCALAVLATVSVSAGEPAAPTAESTETFDSPEAAWKGFVEALKSGDWGRVQKVLGPAAEVIPPPARKPEELKQASEKMGREAPQIQAEGDRASFTLGGRPLPFKVQKTGKGWAFAADPEGIKAQKETIQRMQCMSKLKQMGLACVLYEEKKGGPPPRLEVLAEGPEDTRLAQPTLFACPAVADGKHRPGASPEVPCDYLYIPPKPGPLVADSILAFCPKGNHPGGRLVLQRDGVVVKIDDESEFRKRLKASLDAAGISVEPPKGDAAPAPDGTLAKDREWIKAMAAELGIEAGPPPAATPPEGEKPPEAAPPQGKPPEGKKKGKKKPKGGQ